MNEPQSFGDATRITRVDEMSFTADVPDGWQQGRGAFGGVGIGLCLRALDAVQENSDWPLRAASAEIPSPVMVGETRLEVTPLRRGRGVDALEVLLLQDGELKARVSGIFGKPRRVDVSEEPPTPELPPVPQPVQMPPPFAAHFEMCPTGALPFQSAERGSVEGWVRPRVPFARIGAPELACLCDILWPTFFATVSSIHPAATVAFLLQPTPAAYRQAPDARFFVRSRQLHAGGGFSHELRELWSEQGELLALNPQTFAIIK